MNVNKSFIYILLNLFFFVVCKLQMRVMKTSILHFLPQLKLHHLVLISKMDKKNDVYTIDFTPINQTHHRTLSGLLLGKNVPAELRLRRIKNTNICDDKKILQIWDSNMDEKKSRKLSKSVYNSIQDKEIKQVISGFLLWEESKQYMNLYTRNCQHFGNYAKANHKTYMEQQVSEM